MSTIDQNIPAAGVILGKHSGEGAQSIRRALRMHIRKKSILYLAALPAADNSLFIAHSFFLQMPM
jgi:hypothetical protein